MHRVRVLAALLVLVAGAFVSASEVVTLTDENFDTLVTSGAWLVDFYAPWCGHCKNLAPVFDEVAAEATGVSLGNVDCTVEKELARRFEVRSYPTLKFIRDGDVVKYGGHRTREAFLEFIADVTAPPVTKVKKKSLKRVVNQRPVTFLFLGEEAEEYAVFEKVARRFQPDGGIRCVSSNSNKLKKQFKVDVDGVAVVRITKGGDMETFEGPYTSEALHSWMNALRLPLVSDLSGANFEDIVSGGQLAVMVVTNPQQAQKSESYLWVARTVAKKFAGKFRFAHLDGVRYEKYIEQFGLTQANLPILFVFDYPNEQFYAPDPDFRLHSQENIELFLEQVFSGEIPARTLGVWWSPARYIKWFERWISTFSDSEIITGGVVVTLLFSAMCYWLFFTGDFHDDAPLGAGAIKDKDNSKKKKNDDDDDDGMAIEELGDEGAAAAAAGGDDDDEGDNDTAAGATSSSSPRRRKSRKD